MSEREQKAVTNADAARADEAARIGPSPAAIQRKLIQRKALRDEVAQAKAAESESPAATAAPSGGSPISDGVRQPMEQSFGQDFSSVRVHQGGEAGAMGAVAYAQGENLHFSPGAYQPESKSGKELLGHELTHVVQQREGRVMPQGKDSPINNDPGLEAEADHMGARAAAGESVRVSGSTSSSTASASGPVQAYLGWTSELLKERGAVKGFFGDKTGGGKAYKEILTLLDRYHENAVALVAPWDPEVIAMCREIVAACSRYLTKHRGDGEKEAGRMAAVTSVHLAAMTESLQVRPSFGAPKAPKGGGEHEAHEHEGDEHDDHGADQKHVAPPPAPPQAPQPAQKADDHDDHHEEAKTPAPPSSPEVSVSPAPPTPSVNVSALRSQLGGKIPMGPAPKPPGAKKPEVESKEAESEVSEAPQIGGLMPRMPSGEGTFVVKALQKAFNAAESGLSIADERVASAALSFLGALEDHLKDVVLDENFQWTQWFAVKDYAQLINILNAIESGDEARIGSVFGVVPDAPEAPEEEDESEEAPKPESKAPVKPKKPQYIARQRAKLAEIDARIEADALKNSIAQKKTADTRQTVRKAENYTKLAVKTAASTGLGLVPGAGNVFNVAMAVKSARSSHEHAKKIGKIRTEMVTSGRRDEKDALVQTADYAVGQKTSKRNKAGVDAVASAVPVAGSVVKGAKTVAYKTRGLYKLIKGTRGVERRANATVLVDNAREMDPARNQDARLIILELFNNSEGEYTAVLKGDKEGAINMVMAKLASG